MEFLTIAKILAGVLIALFAVGVVIKITVNWNNSSNRSIRFTSQKHNKAGRDIIGGDSIKKTSK